jgi:multidrug efflux pump subunit AcrB
MPPGTALAVTDAEGRTAHHGGPEVKDVFTSVGVGSGFATNRARSSRARIKSDERARVDRVTDIPIVTPRGATIRLGQIAQVTSARGPTQITRRDRRRTVYVTAYLERASRRRHSGRPGQAHRAGRLHDQPGWRGGDADRLVLALTLHVLLMYLLMVALFGSLLYR